MKKRTFMNGAYRRRGFRRGAGGRSGGAASAIPVPIREDVTHWWDPTNGVVLDGLLVTTWVDRVGGEILSQSVGAEQPTFISLSDRLGHAAIHFTATDNTSMDGTEAVATLFRDQAEHTVVVETMQNAFRSSGQQILFTAYEIATASEFARVRFSGDDPGYVYRDAGVQHSLGPNRDGEALAAKWFICKLTGTTMTRDYRGLDTGTLLGVTASPSLLDAVRLGASRTGGEHLEDGEIGHLMIFDRATSAPTDTAVTGYIENLWANVEVPWRDGDSVWFDPTNDAAMTDDVGVSAWVDEISGLTMAQVVGSAQPTKIASVRTGHQMLVGDGTQFMRATDAFAANFDSFGKHQVFVEQSIAVASSGTETVFSVYEDLDSGNEFMKLSKTGASSPFNTRVQHNGGGGFDIRDGADLPALKAIWTAAGHDGSSQYLDTIGAAELSDAMTVTAPTTLDTLALFTKDGNEVFTGEIGHVTVALFKQTVAEKLFKSTWLEDKWAAVSLPIKLGSLFSFDPGLGIVLNGFDVSAWTDQTTGEVVSQSTGSKQPLYNPVSPTLAAGGPSMTFDVLAQQQLLNTALAKAGVLDSNQPFTAFITLSFNDVTAGGSPAMFYQDGSSSFYLAHYMQTAANSGRHSVRYRDAGTFVERISNAGAATRFEDGVPGWMAIGYDGADTISVDSSEDGFLSITGASAVTIALDALAIGGNTILTFCDAEIGDYDMFAHELDATDRAAMIAHYAALL